MVYVPPGRYLLSDTLVLFMYTHLIGNYRPLINNQFDNIQLKFGPNHEDLSTKIENLDQGFDPQWHKVYETVAVKECCLKIDERPIGSRWTSRSKAKGSVDVSQRTAGALPAPSHHPRPQMGRP